MSERSTELKGIFYKILKDIFDQSPPPNFLLPELEYGPIIGNEIRFIDGSLLNFEETIKEEEMTSYLYEYIRSDTGFFFGFENEGIENGIKKPLYHWHIGIKNNKGPLFPLLVHSVDNKSLEKLPIELIEHNGPHYKSTDMKFQEFLGVIIINFFKEDKIKCKEMLKGLGLLEDESEELGRLIILRNRHKYITNYIEKLEIERQQVMKELKIEESKFKKRK